MDTRAIIDYAMNDDAKAMRDALYASIHDRVNAHIQAQKQVIAQSIFPEEAEDDVEMATESVEELTEGKMDKMSLSHLWHKHAQHSYAHDQGYGHGTNNPDHNAHAATAIENHVRKHHGNKVADDMIDHSTHHVIHAEYAGPEESKHHEKEAAKLRAKNKISGDIYGREEK
jgi:hypothetical protein